MMGSEREVIRINPEPRRKTQRFEHRMNIMEVASVCRLDSSPYSLQQNETVPMLSMAINSVTKERKTICTKVTKNVASSFIKFSSKRKTTVVALIKLEMRRKPTKVFILGVPMFSSFLSLPSCMSSGSESSPLSAVPIMSHSSIALLSGCKSSNLSLVSSLSDSKLDDPGLSVFLELRRLVPILKDEYLASWTVGKVLWIEVGQKVSFYDVCLFLRLRSSFHESL